MRKKHPMIEEEPFNSNRKRMSVWVKDDEGKKLIVMKGASELIIESCKDLLDLNSGEKLPIDQALKAKVLDEITRFAEKSLRTIAICYKHSNSYEKSKRDDNGVLDDEKSGFTLIGIAGISDVIRPEVPNAIA